MEKKQKILKKIEHTERLIEKQKEENEIKLMFKQEENSMKMEEKKLYLKRLDKINEYEIAKKIETIRNKDIKMEEIKNEKFQISCKKREMAEELAKQKKEIKDKFDLVMKKHKNINKEALNKLFPDDKELVDRLMKMKTTIYQNYENRSTKATLEDSSSYNRSNYINNNDKEEKLNIYKAELKNNLDKFIKSEKEKIEAIRNMIENSKDEEEENKLKQGLKNEENNLESNIINYKR